MKNLLSALTFGFAIIQATAQVVVYSDCNYSGSAQNLSTKSYYNSNQIGLTDNTISSLKIPPGYKATVYTDANMKGREVTLTENQKCLPAVLNNAISSIVVSKNTTTIANNGKVSIYRNCNYKGTVKHFAVQNYSDLKKSYNNGTPQSFQIPAGLKVELYSQKNFKGKKLATYTSNQSCIATSIRNAKSMKVTNNTTAVKPQPR